MKAKIYIVMGVSGCGKSTIASMLAEALSLPFFDGDDYHPPANVAKMSAKIPLTDEDRSGWLQALNDLARANSEKGAVIVCSALKERHMERLRTGLEGKIVWVFLKGSFELILARLQARKGHFMPPDLLQSQFATLEEPDYALTVGIKAPPEQIVAEILDKLKSGDWTVA